MPFARRFLILTFFATACLTHNDTEATIFTSFDPRIMAMGGAGTALVDPDNAPLFNPAWSTTACHIRPRSTARFHIGARLHDRDGFLDSLDRYRENDNESRLENAVEEFNRRVADRTVTTGDARAVIDAGRALVDDIGALSDRPLRAAASAGFTAATCVNHVAFAPSVRRKVVGGVRILISEEDLQQLNDVLDFADKLITTIETRTLPADVRLPQPTHEFTSSVEAIGADITETGITVGIGTANGWRLGMTVKQTDFTSVDYRERIQAASGADWDRARYTRNEVDTNLDFGVGWKGPDHWRAGVTAHDLIPRDYRTAGGHTIRIRPMVRGGVAWESRHLLLAADYDLTTNDPTGFDPERQFLAIGGELRWPRPLRLRAGIRIDTNTGDRLPSVGLGLDLRYLYANLAVAERADEAGVSLEFGGRF